MKIECDNGESVEMVRIFDKGQGYDEDNAACMFNDFIEASPRLIKQGVELSLPIYFDVVKI